MRTMTRPPSAWANLAALESRLITTCIRRSRSTVIRGRSLANSGCNVIPFSLNRPLVAASASSRMPFGSQVERRHSIRPVWIRDRSRMSLIRRVRRSDSLTTISRNWLRSASPRSGLSSRISENERIEVSGVRSSWLTVVMNSSFRRSSSVRRWLARFNSSVATSSALDLRSSSRLYSITWEASSRIARTSSGLKSAPLTTVEIMTRAEAAPIAPASRRSAKLTRSGSAWASPASERPRIRAWPASACSARSAPT